MKYVHTYGQLITRTYAAAMAAAERRGYVGAALVDLNAAACTVPTALLCLRTY